MLINRTNRITAAGVQMNKYLLHAGLRQSWFVVAWHAGPDYSSIEESD